METGMTEILKNIRAKVQASYGHDIPIREERYPTGLAGLDLSMRGGIPYGAMIEIYGPPGVGKTQLMYNIGGVAQKVFKDPRIFVIQFEGRVDRQFAAEYCGFDIGAENSVLVIAQKAKGEPHKVFETILDLFAADTFHLGLIDGLGAVNPKAAFKQKGQYANMLTDFTRGYHEICMTHPEIKTALVFTSQVRANMNIDKSTAVGIAMPPLKSADSWGLGHALAGKIRLFTSAFIVEDENQKVDIKGTVGEKATKIGREIQWEIEKGKLGFHEGPRGTYCYFYKTGINYQLELIDQALACNVLTTKGGGYIAYKDQNFHGKERLVQKLTKFSEYVELYNDVLCSKGVRSWMQIQTPENTAEKSTLEKNAPKKITPKKKAPRKDTQTEHSS